MSSRKRKNKYNKQLLLPVVQQPSQPVVSEKKKFEVRGWLRNVLVHILSFVLLVWIALNATELVTSYDLPFVTTIQPLNHQSAMVSVVNDFARLGAKGTSLGDTNFNIPANLFVKSLNYKMEVTDQRVVGGSYYFRPSKGQYIILNKDRDGRMGDVLIYMRSDWRTIPKPDKITPGMLVELQTVNSITNAYQIKEMKTLRSNDRYVGAAANSRQVLLFIDNGLESYTIIRAEQI